MADLSKTDRGVHGAEWWVGNWKLRNFHGYYQQNEGGEGEWQFIVGGFGDTDCTVTTLDSNGKQSSEVVPIDDLDRITILGRKFGRANWYH